MSALRRLPAARLRQAGLVAAVLALAAAARFWFLSAGIPHGAGIDEPQIVDRALRILNTGDWNTHLFDYPPLVIYLHAWVAIARFLLGAVNGEWSSLAGFRIEDVLFAGRAVAAAIGVLTVWLAYRAGDELAGPRVALAAAAILAVSPAHVRESHFVLTDVPATALTTLAVLLAMRAVRVRTAAGYAWAGMAAGLAASAKYNGAVSFVAVVAAWIAADRAAADRWRKIGAAVAAMAGTFVLSAPYALLDLPDFLNGLGAQLARFSMERSGGDPSWMIYAKHIVHDSPFMGPLAMAGAVVALARREQRRRAVPLVTFAAAYYYVLSTHSGVFARYALPLWPPLCVLAALPLVELAHLARRVPALDRPWTNRLAFAALLVVVLVAPVRTSAGWLRQFHKPDTRVIAAEWMRGSVAKGATVAVENNGPTYLSAAGFKVIPTELLGEHPVDWYRGRAQYLVISSADVDRYADYIGAGTIVYQIAPTPQRWGPPIRVVKIG